MDNEQLTVYFPKLGDRIAIYNYCKKKMMGNITPRKQSLLKKLKSKIKDKSKSKKQSPVTSDEEQDGTVFKATSKTTRQIEIGWFCSQDGNRHKQVRAVNGGGTRKINVPKNAKTEYILQRAKELFFPNGRSTKGCIEAYHHDLWDFQQYPIKTDMCVEEIFKTTKLCRLRFYLASTERTSTVVTGNATTDNQDIYVDDSCSSLNNSKLEENQDGASSYRHLVENTLFNLDCYEDELVLTENWNPDINSEQVTTLYVPQASPLSVNEPVLITLHRGHVLKEMLEIFTNLDENCGPIQITMKLPNGQTEAAFDIGGVYRDCLSEFWNSFYDQYTLGSKYKVPYVRHDFNLEKWKAVGKILYRGWIDQRYFPVSLARPFMEYCIFGKCSSDLKDSLLNFLSTSERNILDLAMTDFQQTDKDELFDVMETLECKVVLSQDNIAECLTDIGHKEFIQKPMFIIDSWHPILGNCMSQEELSNIYTNSEPTAKSVLSILKCDDFGYENLEGKKQVFNFLKKFIRECDHTRLKKFMRFVTGADIMTGNEIQLCFNTLQGSFRRPIARTCGCILELSCSYENYPEFRIEMASVLDAGIWIMDII